MKIWQQPLPAIYNELTEAELRVRVQSAKDALGEKLVILGHHYQQDAVIEFADFTGDSFELSRRAAEQKNAAYVIFCGVHFMAESADILTPPHVRVILPDLGAGCSMADMANIDQTVDCWAQLQETCPDQTIVPITYMNSSAAIKSFVGEHGGAVCTSSNCRNVLEWALTSPSAGDGVAPAKKRKILFFPDQHLGRNTAYSMGYPLDRMVLWDPRHDLGGSLAEPLHRADFVLWKGHCSVHQLFRPEHVDQVRQRHPNMKVIVHPECRWEVVQKADMAGSTAFIVKTIEAAPPGGEWAIGTEVHLINRLARAHPEQKITVLSECQCLCTTMYRIDLPHLCWAMENLLEGRVVNQIEVDETTRKWALVALDRMLAIKGTAKPSPIAPQGRPTVIATQAESQKLGVAD
ncbi:MAG TPA: quinolinate synthase NadA [Tepidisphaeraceae bacterium]|jgi:quinolinate synthase|nr:quinolinate synthase NadA [Tepidisphaeraceae bacterium]